MTSATELPVVRGVLGTADHPKGLALRCGLEGGSELFFAIDEAAVAAFLAAITERCTLQGRLEPGKSVLANPLKFEGVSAVSGPECETALAFHMSGGWMLTLGLTPDSLAALRDKISVLSALVTGPAGSRH